MQLVQHSHMPKTSDAEKDTRVERVRLGAVITLSPGDPPEW